MTESEPIACSLAPTDLERRIAAIAAIGESGLIGRGVEGERQLLRFRADPGTRARLEQIVAAEAECCSFLTLELTEERGELVLAISAPEEGRPVAEQLAVAFDRGPHAQAPAPDAKE